jgi:hypothetical protein
LAKTYRGIASQERKFTNALKRQSRIKDNINKERGIHITPAGAHYTREQMQKRRQSASAYYYNHGDELRAKARSRYRSNLDFSRAKVLESYYRNPRNPEKRKTWLTKKGRKLMLIAAHTMPVIVTISLPNKKAADLTH